jgi:hypothetical protein
MLREGEMRIILVLLAFVALTLRAEEKSAEANVMEKFEPGKEHDELKKLEGKYDVIIKVWMDPNAAPEESKASAEFKMEKNGKFLKQEFKGQMMGKPYTATGYDGFDRTVNKYVSVWIDDFSTQVLNLQGETRDGGKTIEFTGDQHCPLNGKVMKMRTVHKQIDADSFTLEMYAAMDGNEQKSMEATYKRKK